MKKASCDWKRRRRGNEALSERKRREIAAAIMSNGEAEARRRRQWKPMTVKLAASWLKCEELHAICKWEVTENNLHTAIWRCRGRKLYSAERYNQKKIKEKKKREDSKQWQNGMKKHREGRSRWKLLWRNKCSVNIVALLKKAEMQKMQWKSQSRRRRKWRKCKENRNIGESLKISLSMKIT
jgi:hypothetical protein